MMSKPEVSVLVPTYKRAHLIGYALEGLEKQTYSNFEVLIILKPSEDGTENVVEKYKKTLNIRLIRQKEGYVADALNLGLEHAEGNIIAFLDDDAIPFPDWLENHVKIYAESKVGGVAGNVIPMTLRREKLTPKDKISEIIPDYKPFLETIGYKIWSRPLQGLENYLVYISKAGTVDYNNRMTHHAWHQSVKSLLGMGANMSVLSKAVEDFRFPNSWVLGLTWEQFLGWYMWEKGYDLIFNPEAKVYHLVHGQTLTREVTDHKKQILRQVESQLLFYRLYNLEPDLSKMHRITWLIFCTLLNIKQIRRDFYRGINMLKGIFLGNVIGAKWLISKMVDGNYCPLSDLEKLRD